MSKVLPQVISKRFTSQDFAAALKHLKPGKAPGPDSICLKLITHTGAALKSWLCGFLSSCMHHLKIPKIWRRALIVAIPKLKKPVEDPKSYDPISLHCKILERLIHACVELIVDALLPRVQAGFQQGRSTVDQVVLLTQNIKDLFKDSFEVKKNAGAVFVYLTAAYDTVWHSGLTCKLLRLLPHKHMVWMIIELVWNRSFMLTTGDSKQSRVCKTASHRDRSYPPSFSTSTLLSMAFQKYAYADDLALLYASQDWKALEDTLSQDMTTLSAYLQTWRLKVSNTKMMVATFYHNKDLI